VELARHGRSAQAELRGETGGSPWLERECGHDAAPGGIGKQFDSGTISSWHIASEDRVTVGAIMPVAALSAIGGHARGRAAGRSAWAKPSTKRPRGHARGRAAGRSAWAKPSTKRPRGHARGRAAGRSAWAKPSTKRPRGHARGRAERPRRLADPGSGGR
jgi:hypothetical protein